MENRTSDIEKGTSDQSLRREDPGGEQVRRNNTLESVGPEEIGPNWSWFRILAYNVTHSKKFDGAILGIIFLNLFFTVYEADLRAKGHVPDWHQFVAWCFIGVYSIEVLIEEVGDVPSASILRVLRIARLIKLIRASDKVRELWLMLHGLASALKAIFWAFIIIAILLIIMSVVAVELIRPIQEELQNSSDLIDCDSTACQNSFATIFDSLCTLFLLVFVQDMWADVALPLVKYAPWVGVVLVSSFIIVNVGLLNLILAVIVDRAEQARQEDEEQRVLDKKRSKLKATGELKRICESLDNDGSGELSKAEIKNAFKTSEHFRNVMNAMDVQEADLDVVFSILDQDRSGTVSPDEFANQLFNMKTQEAHTLLVFLKHYTLEIRDKVTLQLEVMKEELLEGLQSRDDLLTVDFKQEYEKLFKDLLGKGARRTMRQSMSPMSAGDWSPKAGVKEARFDELQDLAPVTPANNACSEKLFAARNFVLEGDGTEGVPHLNMPPFGQRRADFDKDSLMPQDVTISMGTRIATPFVPPSIIPSESSSGFNKLKPVDGESLKELEDVQI